MLPVLADRSVQLVPPSLDDYSKGELGGNLDRHENIGDGHIGSEGFRAVLGSMAFAGKTFLLEVPGIEDDGPDLENVRRLKAIRDDVAAPVRPPGAGAS